MEREFDAIFDVLLEKEVIKETAADIRLTSRFQRAVSEAIDHFERTSQQEIAKELRSRLDSDEADGLLSIYDSSMRTVAEYVTLTRFCEGDLTTSDRTWVVTVVDSSQTDVIRDEETPDVFISVPGMKIPFIEQFYEKSIVYIWLEDCDPCEVVKTDLEDIFDEHPTDVALFSVYGPNASALLQERYNVTGGPMTLFFYKGTVDARLEGAQYRTVLKSGVETHRNL